MESGSTESESTGTLSQVAGPIVADGLPFHQAQTAPGFHRATTDRSHAAVLRAEFHALPETAYVDRATAGSAAYLTRSTMNVLAMKGAGPQYIRVGARVLYLKRDVLRWIADEAVRTGDTAAKVTR